ncbi:unnamed protein product, partial [Didymodactylos carnosus]
QFKLTNDTIFVTIDVSDLYTMVPQKGGLEAIRKMLEILKVKQIAGIPIETILEMAQFVLENNYFFYDGVYYRQSRGGAMGSPFTLTFANVYMYFFERPIHKTIVSIKKGLYYRYIDDTIIACRAAETQVQAWLLHWNRMDNDNIKLTGSIGKEAQFLDVNIKNNSGHLVTSVFHKPSHEPYYLPFSSIHAFHIKRNIPFGALIRAIGYSSTYMLYMKERAYNQMALFLNGYRDEFIEKQFNRAFEKFDIPSLTEANYDHSRTKVLKAFFESTNNPLNIAQIDYEKTMLFHFTYTEGMDKFASHFHRLWRMCFTDTPLGDITPIVGYRNTPNLQQSLVQKKPCKQLLK